MLAGQVITGFSVSVIVTVKEQVAMKLAPSVTLRFTVLLPMGKNEPLGKPLVTVSTGFGQFSRMLGT